MAKKVTKGQIEAEITKALIKFEKVHMGRGPKDAETHLINDIILIRFKGVLTAAEQQLAKNKEGIELIKKIRSNLLENSRMLLEQIIGDITGAKGPCEGYDIFNKENAESADARNNPDQRDGAGRQIVILEVKPQEGREDAAKFVTSFKLIEPGWDKIDNLAGQRAQLWANYKSGGDSSLIVFPLKLSGAFSPEEQRAAGNFAFLVRNALGGMGVPYSDMRVSYVHFHPKGEPED